MLNSPATPSVEIEFNDLYNPQQRASVVAAVQRVRARFKALAPGLAAVALPWMEGLAQTADIENYFLRPLAFPQCLFSWWCEQTCQQPPNPALQHDVVYASVAGYYYIRLMDNLMDRDKPVPPALVPALNIFLTEALGVYASYFPHTHPFWALFEQLWGRATDMTAQDALLTAPDADQFRRVVAQKEYASNLPIAVIAYHYGCPEQCAPWAHFIEQFSAWHQLLNDVFDWQKDDAHEHTTYFLAEAQRRKAATESVAGWVTHTGFAWGCATLQAWFEQVRAAARPLACPDLEIYLDKRQAHFTQMATGVQRAFAQLLPILAALEPPQPRPTVG